MKIALVCPYDLGAPGGVQDQVVKLSGWLRDLGNETLIVGPGSEGPSDAVLLGPVKVIKANAASTPVSLNPRAIAKLKAAVDDAEVVHIHEPLMPLVSLAASRIAHIPTVGTFHADPPAWARRSYGAISPLLKQILAKLDVTTTVSPVSRSAIESFTDARVIPNGIDTAAYGHGNKVRGRVVFLGRDDPRKGLDVLLEAWRDIHGLNEPASLHVIGADRGESPPSVTFLGRVSEAQKLAELAQAEVFVAPNLGGESFGIIVAEGMASGCAVVASGIPAFLHVLGESGVIVAPGDTARLSEAIVAILSDDARRGDLADSAMERVDQFDGMRVSQEYLAAYEDAITKHRA